jgi:hypothetical protein
MASCLTTFLAAGTIAVLTSTTVLAGDSHQSHSGLVGSWNLGSCSAMRGSCVRGLKKKQAWHHMHRCHDRYNVCMQTGCWWTNTEGHDCRLQKR